ncbi:MAG: ParB N-terminal domain-containing protein [Acidobacteriia bacterium]|nr:ParB N-terminal domain-containing protein [Terriglobia bacterium]
MPVRQAFQPNTLPIAIANIIPLKVMTAAYRKTATYRRIAASMATVGLIEPLVVFPTTVGNYVLLDGHTRLDILIATSIPTADCLLAIDNESYTYNKRVNYIPPIAQHHMILRALAHVTEERIAAALNVTVATIRERRDLLKGICPEAADLLRNERVSADAFCALRKMKPVRQIDVAQLMLNAKKFSGRFARALLDGTREELLVPTTPAKPRATTPAQQSLMEQETDELLKHADSIKANYGNDILDLTAAGKYVQRLLDNTRVHRYLAKHHEETLTALEQVLTDTAADKQRRPAKQTPPAITAAPTAQQNHSARNPAAHRA